MMKKCFLLASVFSVSLFSVAANGSEMCTQQTLLEDFEGGSLNESLWSYDIGDGCDINLCGWGNNEKQSYQRENVQLRDGNLVITAKQDGEYITSGKITTRAKFAQRFGRFEARIKVPDGLGLWPAFWLMPDDPQLSWPLEGEIDILERPGRNALDLKTLIGAAHFGELAPNNTHFAQFLILPRHWHDDYHVYAVDWTEGLVVWTVDGREFARFTRDDAAPFDWPFDRKSFFVKLNLAVGGTLGGDVHSESFPGEMLIDYVKVSNFVPCESDKS